MRADKDGLYAYGIMEESSDYHAHVCVQAGILVWCRTRDLQKFHERHGHRYLSYLVGNPPTARGYRVPWVDIPCVRVDAGAELAGWIHKDKTSSERGRKAESVVVALLCNGAVGKLIEGRDAQIRGDDIAIFQPGPFGGNEQTDGGISIEGPHAPQPHRWYARVQLTDGLVTKVIS